MSSFSFKIFNTFNSLSVQIICAIFYAIIAFYFIFSFLKVSLRISNSGSGKFAFFISALIVTILYYKRALNLF